MGRDGKQKLSETVGMIARTIEKTWQNGIVLSPSSLHFIESSVGISSAPELEKIMSDEDFPDRDMVLEMILFPEREYRVVIEPLLPHEGLRQTDVHKITCHLVSVRSSLKIYYTESSRPFSVKLSPDQIQLYISRLFLTRAWDTDIFDSLERIIPPEEILSIRILFRTANYRFNERKKQFILEFTQKAENKVQQLITVIELFLKLLSSTPDAADYELYLLEKVRKEKIRVKSIQTFVEKRDRYNMEYLMLSKYPVPPESLEEARKKLHKLETITHDILGIFSQPDASLELRSMPDINL